MTLGFDVDSQALLNGAVLGFTTIAGAIAGGLFGGAIGLAAGLAFAELSTQLARLDASVRDLSAENERLRRRVSELESE